MGKFLGVAVAGLLVFGSAAGASAALQKVRVRGTIESVNGNTLAIKSYSGRTVDQMLHPGTKFNSRMRPSI